MAESRLTGTLRELEKIQRELDPLAKQGTVEGFFNNVKNADKLGGLVEDIRDAVMEYQVCSQNETTSSMPEIYPRLRYSGICTTRTVNSS